VDLSSVLPAATVMVLTVTATTTSGCPLSESELKEVEHAGSIMLRLDDARRKVSLLGGSISISQVSPFSISALCRFLLSLVLSHLSLFFSLYRLCFFAMCVFESRLWTL